MLLALGGCGPDDETAQSAQPAASVLAASTVGAAPVTQPSPAAGARVRIGQAVPAPEWDALFDRTSGWTGADGIYSVPLDGDERPGNAGSTFFIFSDTFIGEVNARDRRVAGSTFVNNSSALLEGGRPDPARIAFSWRRKPDGSPGSLVVPEPQGAEPSWFWPGDGVVVDGRLFFYSGRVASNGDGGVFGFKTVGVSLLSTPIEGGRPSGRTAQVDAPLYRPPADGKGDMLFGVGVMPNTRAAHAPHPDGFLYVYGLRGDDFNKKLLVARVRPEQIADFAAYRFWTGTEWSPDIAAAAPTTGRVSSELSVTPLPDGRYLLVFQLDTISNKVAVRVGASPVGPWSDYKVVYEAPETAISPNILIYNAKAHPHLSDGKRLLISYNVNTADFPETFSNADIYRPRFIWLPLE